MESASTEYSPQTAQAIADLDRGRHVNTEKRFRELGKILTIIGGFPILFLFQIVRTIASGQAISLPRLAVVLAVAALGGYIVFVGLGLNRLSRKSRPHAIGMLIVVSLLPIVFFLPGQLMAMDVFAGVGLLATVSIFTYPVTIYCLYLLLSHKGRHIFSDEYQRVMAATPHWTKK
jgi:hypothetical protein